MKRKMSFVAGLLLFSSAFAWGEAEAPVHIEAKALEALKAFTEPLTESETFRTTFTADIYVSVGGQEQTMASTYELTVGRPNQFALKLLDGEMGANVFASDGTLSFHIPALERFLETSAPEQLDELFDREDILMLFGSVAMEGLELLPAFLNSDPYTTLLDDVDKVTWIGEEEWNGQQVVRLRGVQEMFDWDLILSKETPSKLLLFQPDFSKMIAQTVEAMPQMAGFELRAKSTYSAWEFGLSEGDAVFNLSIPEGTKKVQDAGALFSAPQPSGGNAASLVGKPAPNVSLPNLEGEEVTLSELSGHKVLILDFWATWCGPCVAAMPDLAEIASKYKDQGVRLLALNQGEEVGRIEKFLENKGLDIEVLLDKTGQAAKGYLVQGIPQTVIIDEKGVVREVHIGYVPQLKQQLAAEIDALLRE